MWGEEREQHQMKMIGAAMERREITQIESQISRERKTAKKHGDVITS